MGRRIPPRLSPGPLNRADADALNSLLADLSSLLGGFSASPPLNVAQDASGVRHSIDTDALASLLPTDEEEAVVAELWANCTLSNLGTLLVLQDQEGIGAVILFAADTYRFVFDVTFVDAEHFQWSGNCIGAYLEEVTRTADSVTVKTNNATAAPRFGIDVRGHLGASGSGSGSGSGALSGSGADTDYGPGGGPDCDNAVELTLGVEYGPFTITPGSGVDWWRFPTLAATPDYHVTLTWINGSDVSVFVFRGDCADLNNWFTTGVNSASPVGCNDNPSPAFDGFGLMYVTAAFGGSYTILADEGPC